MSMRSATVNPGDGRTSILTFLLTHLTLCPTCLGIRANYDPLAKTRSHSSDAVPLVKHFLDGHPVRPLNGVCWLDADLGSGVDLCLPRSPRSASRMNITDLKVYVVDPWGKGSAAEAWTFVRI